MEPVRNIFLALVCLVFWQVSFAQEPVSPAPDKTGQIATPNTASPANTTLEKDAALVSESDSTQQDSTKNAKSSFEKPIKYSATDSIITRSDGLIFMHKNGKIETGKMKLEADYIELNQDSNVVFARGVQDSTGKWIGKPVFTDDGESWETDSILYNFKTQKGITYGVFSEQQEGYLHAGVTKKHEDGSIHVAGGKFTTCDAKQPHFHLALTKAKLIPDDKIVSGPLYFVIADIPLPLFIPFGFLPTIKKARSGVLMPSYGEEARRGFFLKNGGYYFAINNHLDLTLRGDIYSKGTWALYGTTRYKKRYKYSGNFKFDFNRQVTSEKGLPDYKTSNAYSVKWSHQQDTKAKPNSNFSASVNFEANDYTKYNSTQHSDYLQTSKSSSVSYRRDFPSTPFHLTSNMRISQNTRAGTMDLQLPVVTFNMDRQYPVKVLKDALGRPSSGGKKSWYKDAAEKLSIGFNSNFQNSVSTTDSLLFTQQTLDKFNYGLKYSVPVSTNFKMLKYFSVSPSFSYNAKIYPNYLKKRWDDDLYLDEDSILRTSGREVVDTITGFNHLYDFNYGVSVNTKLYGMYNMNPNTFMGKHLKAVRHVITPRVGYSIRPDFTTDKWGYFGNYSKRIDEDSMALVTYNRYQNGVYGGAPGGTRSGSVSFGLDNNLEMKIADKNDTTGTGSKKISLIDALSLSSSYNLQADSLNMADISFSGRTTIFKGLSLNFSGQLDPYVVDSTGNNINESEWARNHRIGRLTSIRFSTGYGFNNGTFKRENGSGAAEADVAPGSGVDEPVGNPLGISYVDFAIPWSLNFNYSFNVNRRFDRDLQRFKSDITQSLNFTGNLTLTSKWRVSFRSGYDFEQGRLTSTSFNIYRDLHCWEATMFVVPFGQLKSYNFTIRIKSAMFEGVKWEKKKSHFDN